ncbi:MAG: TusE/DsrC/DsvC family sulfur relay protein [Gammaproteobacteria bacterium]
MIKVQGKVIETDDEGYLLKRDDWSEQVAEAMATVQAQQDHVKLTETHWGLIQYFRDYYNEYKVHPTMHKLVMTLGKQHGEHFHDEKAYEKFLYDIFPHGPVQELCKLAGLPKPLGDTEQ